MREFKDSIDKVSDNLSSAYYKKQDSPEMMLYKKTGESNANIDLNLEAELKIDY